MSISGEVYEALRDRERNLFNLEMMGDGHMHTTFAEAHECPQFIATMNGQSTFHEEPCLGVDPLFAIEMQLNEGIRLVKEFKNHKHEWSEQGFCFCGRDGNA